MDVVEYCLSDMLQDMIEGILRTCFSTVHFNARAFFGAPSIGMNTRARISCNILGSNVLALSITC